MTRGTRRDAILGRMVKEGLSEKGVFYLSLIDEKKSDMLNQGKHIVDRGNGRCKNPEAGTC